MFKNTGRHPTPEQLKRFNPLSELTPQQHELLSNSLAIYTASEGKRLLKAWGIGTLQPLSAQGQSESWTRQMTATLALKPVRPRPADRSPT